MVQAGCLRILLCLFYIFMILQMCFLITQMWDGKNYIWVAIIVAIFIVNYILNAWFARTSQKCNEKAFGFLGVLPLGWVGKSCLPGGHVSLNFFFLKNGVVRDLGYMWLRLAR